MVVYKISLTLRKAKAIRSEIGKLIAARTNNCGFPYSNCSTDSIIVVVSCTGSYRCGALRACSEATLAGDGLYEALVCQLYPTSPCTPTTPFRTTLSCTASVLSVRSRLPLSV